MNLHKISTLVLCFLFAITIFAQKTNYAPNQLLIQWKNGTMETRKNMVRNQIGAATKKIYNSIHAELLEFPEGTNPDIEATIRSYKDHLDLEVIEPNFYTQPTATVPNDDRFEDQWALKNIGQTGGAMDADIKAIKAWDFISESPGVKVAVIDSGIDYGHEDLKGNIWINPGEYLNTNEEVIVWDAGSNRWIINPLVVDGNDNDNNGYTDDIIGWDFRNDDNDPMDDLPHGTHVAGVLGAAGNNGKGIAGVSWNIELVGLKVLNDKAQGAIADIIEALAYATLMDIPISNISLESPYSDCFRAIIDSIEQVNHLIVASSGNSGADIDLVNGYKSWPASFPNDNIITVGNTDNNDLINLQSNYGENSVDLYAPGTNILSCLPGDMYGFRSGTSQSAPHVTGACALLLDAHPQKTALEIKDAILNTVDILPGLSGQAVTGGRLNLYKALQYYGPVFRSCRQRDSLALVALYNATDGANWNTTWDLNTNMATWNGVFFSGECVNLINLPNNNLTGTLPEELGYMDNLQFLFLNNNQLSGSLPEGLSGLSNMGSLPLGNNQYNFDAFESFNGSGIGDFRYVPQDSISTFVNGNILFVDAGGTLSNNRYTWYKDGSIFSGPTSGDSTIIIVSPGVYNCEVTNDIATNTGNANQNLVLHSKKMYVDPMLVCRERDSILLRQFYAEANGTSWGNNWNMTQPMDTWHGVSLNASGCVTTLDLNNNQLSGMLSPRLGELSELENLFLSNNQITGSIPAAFRSLGNLRSLVLNNNFLTGSIPEELGEMSNLYSLNLSVNKLDGEIPTAFGNLSNLAYLRLSDNKLTGTIPPVLGNLSSLVSLYLQDNQLVGNIPNELSNLSGLAALWVQNNNLSGNVNPDLGTITSLTTLNLGNNYFSGTIPPSFGSLASLKYLSLQDNMLSGSIPLELSNLNSLTTLLISINKFTFAGMEPLVGNSITNFEYALQDSVSIQVDGSLLYVDAGGTVSNNTYVWYLNDVAVATIVGDNTFAPTVAGLYQCEISNNIVTNNSLPFQNLVLKSKKLFIDVSVWPGDFNSDGIANNDDLTYWGLAASYTGGARPGASLNWAGQDCPDWSFSVMNINSKHQDGNGDGLVDSGDIQALISNYGLTHDFTPSGVNPNSNEYRTELLPPNVVGTLRYALYLEGDSPVSIHGFSCSIHFGNLPVLNATIDVSNSSLNPSQHLGIFLPAENRLDIALTRSDRVNQLVNGALLIIEVETNNVVIGASVNTSFNRGITVFANETINDVLGTSYTHPYTETGPNNPFLNLAINAVHAACNTLGSATVQINGGLAPYEILWNTDESTTEITNLNPGTYTVTVTDSNGDSAIETIDIQGQFLPITDENGSVTYCGPVDCPSILEMVYDVTSGMYRAHAQVHSDGHISAGEEVFYRAGVSILLKAGFEVQGGATFEAVIEACEQP